MRPKSDSVLPLLLTMEEVAQLLRVSSRSVRRLRAAGAIPAPLRIGGALRWCGAEFQRWIEAGCPARERARRGN